MANRNILHMVTPLKHMSPFDVNMALDAGYDAVVRYTQVTVEEIRGLVQDAIFSRAPQDGPRTALFIAGREPVLALDMLAEARKAMVPPFALSVFADPSGAFTTAAAMIACVEKKLVEKTGSGLLDKTVLIFGGSGAVGFTAAVIAAQQGAAVTLAGHNGDERVKKAAAAMKERFEVQVEAVDGSGEEKCRALISEADVLLCAAPAGVRVVSADLLTDASRLLVAADVNAVPPSGIEGVGMNDNGASVPGTPAAGIGPLAIGNIKYRTESGLFLRMLGSDVALALDFFDAFKLATELTNK